MDYCPDLSVDARRLLTEVSNSSEHIIVAVRGSDGMSVRVNEKEFVRCMNDTTAEYWRSVIFELADNGLIHAGGDDKAIFYKITPRGTVAAAILKGLLIAPARA